ncbi:MAG: M48 family metallopeptidase [Candidatus Omnitrophica bacterium]|nr:M48 family metallopeptidase [Candidatus Omnitrophota bacterium]MCM8828489.1 M48 family metallopeptidase [Candidatus Omnitrophota bacterium]
MKKGFITKVLLLAIFLAGCATYHNPVTGKQEQTVYTEKDEIDMGIALDRKICSEFKIVEDPDKVFSGFTRICTRIAANNDRPHLPYKFKVIEKNEVNAFSIPGGFVYVYTGLLKQIDSPDELACVIGHEVAHICNRDAVHRLEKQILYSIPAGILFGSGRQKAIQQAADTIFTISMLKYSRTQEIQADTLGMTYAFRANFNPEGMISFFRKMQELEKKQPSLPLTFLSDHPDTEQRIQNAQIVISKLGTNK